LNKLQLTSLAVVQQPTLGYKLARPRWKLSTALALFLGIFGGIAFAFMRESLSETFGLPEQIENEFGVPVLATLNLMPSQAP
jgi:capsular polysaccharide biosynthesis protein